MTQKYALAATPTNDSRGLGNSKGTAVQLSDGSLVSSYYEPATGCYTVVRHGADRTAAPTVLLGSGASAFDVNCPIWAIARDDLDNLYVLGTYNASSSSGMRLVTLIKGGAAGAPTWTVKQNDVMPTVGGGSYTPSTAVMYWVNIGASGTGNAGGRLMALMQLTDYSWTQLLFVDLPDKTGAASRTGSLITYTGQGTNTGNYVGIADLRQDGFGSANFLATVPNAPSNPTFAITSITMPASGTAFNGGQITVLPNTSNVPHYGVFITRVAPGKFIVIFVQGGSAYAAIAVSLSAVISTGPAVVAAAGGLNIDPNGVAYQGWGAMADPRLNGKAQVLSRLSAANGVMQFARLGVTLNGTTLTWDTQVTADDAITAPASSAAYGRLFRLRIAHDVASTLVDWQATISTTNADSFATYGSFTQYNTLPSAPPITSPSPGQAFDRSQAIRVAATHTDVDGNPQAALKVQLRVAGTVGVWLEYVRTDAVGYIDVPAFTLAGNVIVRAATSDGIGFGDWSSPVAFTVGESFGAVSSRPPSIDPLEMLTLVQQSRTPVPALAVVATVAPLTITLPATVGGATVAALRNGGYTPVSGDTVDAELVGDVWVVRDKIV